MWQDDRMHKWLIEWNTDKMNDIDRHSTCKWEYELLNRYQRMNERQIELMKIDEWKIEWKTEKVQE